MATYDLGRFRLRTGCDRDAQARALARIEELAEGDQQLRDNLRHGSHIGTSPQTAILDYGGQESAVYVYGDGRVEVYSEEVDPWALTPEEFRKAIDPDHIPEAPPE